MREYLSAEPIHHLELMALPHGSRHVDVQVVRGEVSLVILFSKLYDFQSPLLLLACLSIPGIGRETLLKVALDQIPQVVRIFRRDAMQRPNRLMPRREYLAS
jgi:hypothetical protein